MINHVDITYEEKRYQMPIGITIEEFLNQITPMWPQPLIAEVNGELQELSYPLFCNSYLKLYNYTTHLGNPVYQRTLCFLLYYVCARSYPGYKLKILHSINNGKYCELRGEPAITNEDIAKISRELEALILQDLPIARKLINKDDAASFFSSIGQKGKPDLISHRTSQLLPIYTINNFSQFFFGPMITRTGSMREFKLLPFDKGFVLSMPDALTEEDFEHEHFIAPKHLHAVLKTYDTQIEMLNVQTAYDINKEIESGNLYRLIVMSENIHQRQLNRITDAIVNAFPQKRLVLIAGPSSSGKTTFANHLSVDLQLQGHKPVILSMDNYFVNKEDSPRDAKGDYNFESIYALDLPLFNQHLQQLLRGETVETPIYDFATGHRSEKTIPMHMEESQVLLVEGIHGLNPMLTEAIPNDQKMRIYISCLVQLNLDSYTPISSSDSRELRRMTRDMQFRQISPEETILRWGSVRAGENKNIFPFQENADMYFNSALVYELPIIRPLIEDALKKITKRSLAYHEAQRLLELLQYFVPASGKQIPISSILQEFLGNGCYPHA